MRRMILACSVLLALSTGATAGQIYKWVDGQGNVHFGSQPPEGQDAAAVNPNISQPKAGKPPTQPIKPKQDDAQQQADNKVKEEVAKREAELKKFCETTRNNLAQMRNNPRVRIEENGEIRKLPEEERQTRIAEAEAAIQKDCQ